jgi:GNAT superfamily N-acetyltransferase
MKNSFEQSSTTSVNSPEFLHEAVLTFREQIERADGEVVALSRTVNGDDLLITTRLLANPLITSNPPGNKYFFGWELNKSGVGAFTGVLLVDMYAQKGDSASSIGHMDWWIKGDYANGGGNMHGALNPQTDFEKLSHDRWGKDWDGIAFRLGPEYRGEGLGSLMIASSGVALAANGVKKFYTGGLLDPAVNAYARFGIAPSDFPRPRYYDDPEWIYNQSLPIERLSENPQTNQLIERFVS